MKVCTRTKLIYTFACVFLLSYFNQAIAQPAIQWQSCRGGSGGEIGYAIANTTDSGFIMCGQTNSNNGEVSGLHSTATGNDDGWVVKTDSVGNFQWQICLGDTMLEILYSIIQTSDGGYLACGFTNSTNGMVTGNHGGGDAWLIKLDNTGNFIWQKCLGGTLSDYFKKIIAVGNNQFVVCGFTTSNDGDVTGNHNTNGTGTDAWAVKIDSVGNILWQKCFGGSGGELFNSVLLNQNNQLVFCGSTSSNDFDVIGNHIDTSGIYNNDFWIAVTDTSGTLLNQKCFGGSQSEIANDIIQINDLGYALTGISTSNDGDVSGSHPTIGLEYLDAWTIKTDNTLNLQFQKCFGGTYGERGQAILKTLDGNIVVTGSADSYDGDATCNHNSTGSLTSDAFTVKYDTLGNLVWHKCLGGMGSDGGYDLISGNNNNIILAGLAKSIDGDVIGLHGLEDFWIVSLADDSTTGVESLGSLNLSCILFPNPANNIINVLLPNQNNNKQNNLQLIDISGKIIFSQSSKNKQIPIDVTKIENGIYFLKMNGESETNVNKIIVQH